jgi:hypothetical protein
MRGNEVVGAQLRLLHMTASAYIYPMENVFAPERADAKLVNVSQKSAGKMGVKRWIGVSRAGQRPRGAHHVHSRKPKILSQLSASSLLERSIG